MPRPPLTRATHDRVIAGVARGLSDHLGVPLTAARVAFVIATLLGGAGALMYAWLWGTVPQREGEAEPLRNALTRPRAAAVAGANDGQAADTADSSRAFANSAPGPGLAERWTQGPRLPIAEYALGGGLLVAGVALVLAQFGVSLQLDVVLPALAVLVGVGLAWWQIADRRRPERHQAPRVLGALALVAVGVLMFFVTAGQPNAWTVIAAALAVLAGVALAIAPWLLRINRELVDERAARARELERAEIAAHLHDSVLQTLALIQQRAVPGSDIDRLARGQERELREWLFRGADGAGPEVRVALERELNDYAARLETSHAVRFEVIAVGTAQGRESLPERTVPEAIAGAAKEAMLNAAQHAGGRVTVYLELTAERASVDISDRGDGVDLETIAVGRMGIRESILGRMKRAGGEAEIKQGPGGAGTSVRLSIPLGASAHADTAHDHREEPA